MRITALARARSTGGHDRWHRQLARFSVVGALNAAIDLIVFNLLLAVGPTRRPAQLVAYNTVAVLAAIANSYWWNTRWTFRHHAPDRRARVRRRVLFLGQAGVNVAVNDAAVAGLAILFSIWQILPPRLAGNVTKVLGMLIASLVSFAVMRLVVFRHHPEQGPGDSADAVDAKDAVDQPPTAAELPPTEPRPPEQLPAGETREPADARAPWSGARRRDRHRAAG
jgi:putative flippase GtrA